MANGLNHPTAGPGGMVQQIQCLQHQLAEAQEQPEHETVTASSGGGAIRVGMSGDQKCRSAEVSPELMSQACAEMLQELILSAVNLALDQSRAIAAGRLGLLAGRMPF